MTPQKTTPLGAARKTAKPRRNKPKAPPKIRFELLAPYNTQAALMGSFSGWKELPMKRDRHGVYSTEVPLPDGVYEYKFYVCSKSFFCKDQWVSFADPKATQIAAENAVIRIKNGQRILDEYSWQQDGVPLSGDDRLVIYELHINAFGGGYRAATQHLDYLRDLGINCVQLMPISEYPGACYWGYNPRHPFAPESSYGLPEDLKYFIDACHGRGIRVMLDIVLNHSEQDNPLTRIDFTYWFYAPGTEPDDPGNIWGPKFNLEFYDPKYQRYPAREFLYELAEFWVREYHIDGYRIDAARQIRNFDFLAEVARRAKHMAGVKPFYVVAEHIPEKPTIADADGPVDGAYHETYYWMIHDLLVCDQFSPDQIVNAINPVHHGYSGPANAVNFYENHDKPRLHQRLIEARKDETGAFRRLECAAALLFTSVGIPMLYQGQALGQAYPQDEQVHPLDWSLLDQKQPRALLERYRGLIALRRATPALWTANCAFFHVDPNHKVLAYVRYNDSGSQVAVVAHLGDGYLGCYQVAHFPEDGPWHEWTRDYELRVMERRVEVELSAWDVHIFCQG
ncbi:alpha-amylase family glycosyl hydrolase [Anthocerotibacter panamensis]|uniref:alpha-amylase family glycosyl hydrolase n=1 Tax=Anthocerotibacter panamensis TaxID=2857077 RepID=UPI001C408841|nr:alpha-amylase family glycosyl hydrolase [Anthocerotibacter panamensis]